MPGFPRTERQELVYFLSWALQCNAKCMALSWTSDPSSCLLHPPRTIMPSWFMTLTAVAHCIPLSLIISYFMARGPSHSEYENKNIPNYHLMYKSPLWDTSTSLYSLQEDSMVVHRTSQPRHGCELSCLCILHSCWHHRQWLFYCSLRPPCQSWHDNCSADSPLHHLATEACSWLQYASPALGYPSTQGQENSPVHYSAWHEEHCESNLGAQILHQWLHALI